MSELTRASRFVWLCLIASLFCLPQPGLRAADSSPSIAPSQNLTINLIRRLVEKGVLSQADANDVIRLAEADTQAAKASALASTPAPASAPAQPSDTVRVAYVPEFVKKQLREEVKQEVLAQAREERWAAPRTLPEWVSRYSFFGDLRLRAEGIFYPAGNDNTGAFPNFNTLNSGSPFDIAGTTFSPQLNVDRNRQRERLRLRLGADIDLGENYTAGVRLATGENNSPVTTNQSLGASGGFSKYAVWLDRAFIRYQSGLLAFTAGRFDNPFFSTHLIFDEDLGFDGIAATSKFNPVTQVKSFVTLGAFPVYNSSLNFSSIQPSKFKSQDKWLLGGQLGSDFSLAKDLSLKFGGAYYYFYNIAGKLSSPFTPISALDNGDTDETRPAFAQTGNTYLPLRQIVPNVLNNFGTLNQFQYFGLATPFQEVALTARMDYNRLQPVQLSLIGEWVNNLAFHRGTIRKHAVNNLGAGGTGDFAGGQNAWNLEFRIGSAALIQRGDWTAALSYRYLETDSVVDGFTDSDFGNGGTNLQGFTLGGTYALSRRTSLGLRWLSTSNIVGPRYKNDILQVDFNGKF
jgi:hypothetical protein